jgi:ribosomal protein L11 methylase PrmA
MITIFTTLFFYLALALAILVTAFYVIPVVSAFYITGGSTFVPTSKEKIEKVLDLVQMEKGSLVVDLGCGDGRFLIAAEKRYGVKAIGYEINITAYLLARLKLILNGSQAKVFWKDFFRADLSSADYIFCYLFPDAFLPLKRKFDKELKPGCTIVSCDYPIEDWHEPEVVSFHAHSKEEKIYIYRL